MEWSEFVWKHIIASTTGGFVVTLTLTPLDVVKGYLQSSRGHMYSGATHAVREIVRNEGMYISPDAHNKVSRLSGVV